MTRPRKRDTFQVSISAVAFESLADFAAREGVSIAAVVDHAIAPALGLPQQPLRRADRRSRNNRTNRAA